MKKKNHKIVRLAVTASMLASLGVGLYSVSLGNNAVAQAEQLISSNPIADDTSPRSITFWKYEVKDVSEIGERGDGKEKDVDKQPLAGIKFEVKKVAAIEGGKSLENPLKQKEGVDYTVGETVGTVTTGADGSAKIELGTGRAADGIYLVTELADERVAKSTDPFFVHVPQTDRENKGSLIYDVHVQPKNILNSLIEPDKTIEDGRGYSIKAGQTFDWEAQANIPNGLYQVADKGMVISPVYDKDGEIIADIPVNEGDPIYANYFTMTDTLVKELMIDGVKVQTKTENGEWTDLIFEVDYTITLNGEVQENVPIKDTTNAEKKVEMTLTQAGMKKVVEAKNTKIRTVYTTYTAKDFNGVITNDFSVDFLTPGLKPVHTENPEENDPEYYTGGFDIEKTAEDKSEGDNKLSGAEFMISENRENAEKEIFIASDGESYHKDADLPDGVEFLKATTNEEGFAEFNGLPLNWYEDENNNGKQDIDEEPTFSHENIKRDYWLVETKAPEGYELLKKPQSVTVTLDSHNNLKLDIVNKPKTDLPFTGGEGTMLLVAIAIGAITIGTVAITIEKKRRNV